MSVVEVDRPNRQVRRRQGKSDALDAIAAARSVLAGTALGAPKTKGGNVEGTRTPRTRWLDGQLLRQRWALETSARWSGCWQPLRDSSRQGVSTTKS